MTLTRRETRAVEAATTGLCGLCHLACDRLRAIVGVGNRRCHEHCERRLTAMGYTVEGIGERRQRRAPR